MTLYFGCRINKKALLQTVFFFGDFAHWEVGYKYLTAFLEAFDGYTKQASLRHHIYCPINIFIDLIDVNNINFRVSEMHQNAYGFYP